MLYRYVIDFVHNKIQFAQGNQLNDNHTSQFYNISLENQLESLSYAQFISGYSANFYQILWCL